MGSLVLIRGQIPQLTPKQKLELAKLDTISDEDIDYSDIPPLRDDERGKFKPLQSKENIFKKFRVEIIED